MGDESIFPRPAFYAMRSGYPEYDDMAKRLDRPAEPGLSKRELFAAMALQGCIHDVVPELADLKFCVEFSVKASDLLLAELAKEKRE